MRPPRCTRDLLAALGAIGALIAAHDAAADGPDASIDDAGAAEGAAPADEGVAACIRAFEAAQPLRDDGKLLAARTELTSCARAECPEVVHRKCREWLQDVARDMPSVTIRVSTGDDRPTTSARVRIDGAPAALADGVPIELDPGPHVVDAELDGAMAKQRVDLARGDRSKVVALALPRPASTEDAGALPPPRVAPDAPSARLHPITWTALAVGGAGLIVGTIAGAVTLAERTDVADTCAGATGCTQEEIDPVYTAAHVSTIGFACAGVGAAVALASWLALRPSRAAALRRATLLPAIGGGLFGGAARFPLD